jgi:hypothetical protein
MIDKNKTLVYIFHPLAFCLYRAENATSLTKTKENINFVKVWWDI